MLVPLFLNAPLVNKEDDKPLVEFRLRMNLTLDFLENDKFDQNLMVYDENYQNSVVQSPTFIRHILPVCDLITQNFNKSISIMEVGYGKGELVHLLERNGLAVVSRIQSVGKRYEP